MNRQIRQGHRADHRRIVGIGALYADRLARRGLRPDSRGA